MNLRALILLTAVALTGLAVFSPSPADAAPQEPPVAVITTAADGGQPDPVTVMQNKSYAIQCPNAACAKFYRASQITDGGPAIACTSASGVTFLPVSGVTDADRGREYRFQTGGLDRVLVRAVDGGVPNCTLKLDTVNP